MVKVITYGTFDLFHIGHLNIIRRAGELGDYLVVAISNDESNALKGKEPTVPFEDRKVIVEALKYVDEVIPESDWDQKVNDIKSHNIDRFVMGMIGWVSFIILKIIMSWFIWRELKMFLRHKLRKVHLKI